LLSKKKLLILFAVLISFSFSSCSHKQNETAPVDKNQYLNLTLDGDPQGLDPSKNYDTSSLQVLTEVNESLTRLERDQNGKQVVRPAGAKSYDVTPDGLNWTFRLRDNKWSDGKEVTAKDYEYGIKRTLDPKTNSQKAFLLYIIKGAKDYNTSNSNISSDVVAVKALDDKTLKITLGAPCAYFLNLTCFSIMQPQREDIVKKYSNKYALNSDTTLFCGPFKVKQWIYGDRVELIKNENYWDKNSVKLQKVNMKILKENNTTYSKISDGSIDAANIIQPDLKNRLNKQNKFDVITVQEPISDFEVFNQNNEYFKNVNIRKAFSLAIDREEVSKTLWKGVHKPAYGLIPPSIQIGDEYFRSKVSLDPIKGLKEASTSSRKLFEQGLKEIGFKGNPSSITITYLQPGKDYEQRKIAEFFKNMYEKNLGVHIKVEYVPWDEFEKKISSGDYELASMMWTSDFNDPMSQLFIWVTGANFIKVNWSNERYDSLIKSAAFLPQTENNARFENFKEAENILLAKDTVIAPTVYRNSSLYKYKYVKNIMCTTSGSLYEIKYAYTQGR
jgi:oligopeptide transport system substrate-binding protein